MQLFFSACLYAFFAPLHFHYVLVRGRFCCVFLAEKHIAYGNVFLLFFYVFRGVFVIVHKLLIV